jgi:hypothetical protein
MHAYPAGLRCIRKGIGNTGDGWNHPDGLQTNAAISSVPVPAASAKFSVTGKGAAPLLDFNWSDIAYFIVCK